MKKYLQETCELYLYYMKIGLISGAILFLLLIVYSLYVKAQSTFTGWGGSCTGNQSTCQVSISSTATKTVTATFNVLNSAYGSFSSNPVNEPTAAWTPYSSSSWWNVKIPVNPQYATSSATWVGQINSWLGATNPSTVFPNSNSGPYHPTYFVKSGDGSKWYKLPTGLHSVSGSPSPNGYVFQIPTDKTGVGAGSGGTSDNHFSVINQITNIATECANFPFTLPAGGADAASAVTIPITLSSAYCSNNNILTDVGYGPGTVAQFAESGGILRYEDLKAGLTDINGIKHALFGITPNTGGCIAGVYPSTSTCAATSGRAPVGSLFYYDQPCSTIATMSGLNVVQRAILCAAHNYGIYIGDQGGSGTYLNIHLQNSGTYLRFQNTDPMVVLLNTYNGGQTISLPSAVGANMHVVDPCVVKTMTGVSGGC